MLFYALEMLKKTKHTKTLVLNFSSFVYVILLALLPSLSFRAKMRKKLFLSHHTANHRLLGVGFKLRNTRACAEVRVCACVRSGQMVSRSFAWWRERSTVGQKAGLLSVAIRILTKDLIVTSKGSAYEEIK